MTASQSKFITFIKSIYEIVLAHPDGYPSGHLYAQLMSTTNMSEYEALIERLVRENILTKKGDLLFVAFKL